MTRYANGANLERQIADKLTADGYWTIRAAGSHGLVDIVALKDGETLLVQAKADGRLDPGDWNALLDLGLRLGAVPLLAHRPKRGVIAFERLVGRKSGVRGTARPSRAWSADHLIDNDNPAAEEANR